MPLARIPKENTGRPRQRRQREGMSVSHLSMVRQCPCVICGKYGCDPHHLLRTGERGMGMKSPDKDALPLCLGPEGHHTGPDSPHAHGNEDAWFASHGLDGRAIAKSLWAKRGDYDAMVRICENAAWRAT